jgi:pimeloyl-ACP methyl ester carboxylesterase
MSTVSGESVVFVPGIWMPAIEMQPLRLRLESAHGLAGRCFGYRSVRDDLEANAERLATCIETAGTGTVHVVGHSLGGVLALYTLATHRQLPPGRVVCLGSPLCGSRAAETLNRHGLGRRILGRMIVSCVVERPASEWAAEVTSARDVGVIAGTRALGFGRWITGFDDDSDGTVTVSETRLPGASDHLLLSVSHTAMVLSPAVARHAAMFLKHGRFSLAG